MLASTLTQQFIPVFETLGMPAELARVTVSDRRDLCDYQCNGALQGARVLKQAPRAIAEKIVAAITSDAELAQQFSKIEIAGPGFINLTLTDAVLGEKLGVLARSPERLGNEPTADPQKIVIDFCGPNLAKSMHPGHLRTTVIGDTLQRILSFRGHETIGDAHFGDWGLPVGSVIYMTQQEQPDLPYFDPDFDGDYPIEPPFTIADLARMYPAASKMAKEDKEIRRVISKIVAELQQGHKAYRALWQHMMDVSHPYVRDNTDLLNVTIDHWLGESDADPYVQKMIPDLAARSISEHSEGATVVFVNQEDDKNEFPPLIVVKTDGGVGYGTTDVATIWQRQQEFNPDKILYVVDARQSLHLEQAFRVARKAGYATRADGQEIEFYHLGYGTMNGPDGKPFKSRDGGLLPLEDLLAMAIDKATERLREMGVDAILEGDAFGTCARQIGIGAVRFAELSNAPRSDYIFNVDQMVSFEGKTGPYLQYTCVRLTALFAKADAQNIRADANALTLNPDILGESAAQVRDLVLELLNLGDTLTDVADDLAPHILCEALFKLGQRTNALYQSTSILGEKDPAKQAALLALLQLARSVLGKGLDLLGIEIPQKM